MRCIACKNGTTDDGATTVSVDTGTSVVVIRGVPAAICSTCGEEYLDTEVLKEIEIMVEQARRAGVDVSVQQFKAA